MRYFKVIYEGTIDSVPIRREIACQNITLDNEWAIFSNSTKTGMQIIILAVPRARIINIVETDKDFAFLPV